MHGAYITTSLHHSPAASHHMPCMHDASAHCIITPPQATAYHHIIAPLHPTIGCMYDAITALYCIDHQLLQHTITLSHHHTMTTPSQRHITPSAKHGCDTSSHYHTITSSHLNYLTVTFLLAQVAESRAKKCVTHTITQPRRCVSPAPYWSTMPVSHDYPTCLVTA